VPAPASAVATCCITSTAACGFAEVPRRRQWGLAGESPAGYSGGEFTQALDLVLFPADQVVLGALQPARLITALEPRPIRVCPAASRSPAAERLGPEPRGAWLGGCWAGSVAAARRSAEPASLAPGWRPQRALSSGSGALAAAQGRPQRRPRSMNDPSSLELGRRSGPQSLKRAATLGQNLAKLATYDGASNKTAQNAVLVAEPTSCGRCQGLAP